MSGESCFLPRRQDKVRDSRRSPSSSLQQKSVSKSGVKIVPYPQSLCPALVSFISFIVHVTYIIRSLISV